MAHNKVDVTQPSSVELRLSRVFAAPSSLCFDAWTKPELLQRWYGPQGWQLVVCEIDLRVGGAWRFVSQQPSGRQIGQHGVFREVAAGQRIVQTEEWEDWNPGEVIVTTRFEELGGTTRVTTSMQFPSEEVRDLLVKAGMTDGYGEAGDKLELLLSGAANAG
jgi:uncharacterized protein YndB with AHSA1/START domain